MRVANPANPAEDVKHCIENEMKGVVMMKQYEMMNLLVLVFGLRLFGLEMLTLEAPRVNLFQQACWVSVNLGN